MAARLLIGRRREKEVVFKCDYASNAKSLDAFMAPRPSAQGHAREKGGSQGPFGVLSVFS